MTEPFQNLSVNTSELPQVEASEFHGIEKAYLKVTLITNGIFFLVLFIGTAVAIYFGDEVSRPTLLYAVVLGPIFLFWLINTLVVFKAFPKKQYSLREKDIIYCKGWLWSVRTSIPFNRIQHAELKQGPLERIFKLHSLKIFTAGGQSSDLVIPGLPEGEALRIKEFVLGKTAQDGGDNQ